MTNSRAPMTNPRASLGARQMTWLLHCCIDRTKKGHVECGWNKTRRGVPQRCAAPGLAPTLATHAARACGVGTPPPNAGDEHSVRHAAGSPEEVEAKRCRSTHGGGLPAASALTRGGAHATDDIPQRLADPRMASMVSPTASSTCEISSRAAKEPCVIRSCVGGRRRGRARLAARRAAVATAGGRAAAQRDEALLHGRRRVRRRDDELVGPTVAPAKASTPAHVKAGWVAGSASPCCQTRSINLRRTSCTKLR